MVHRAAVIGGSVAGLASAIGLARRGWEVTVVERDVAPDTDDGDEAFLVWDRRNVPQFRQPHGFSARSRNLLLEHIPEVVDWLRADGIPEINLFKMLAPPELWSDEDDAYTGLWSRRPAFELAIRRTAEGRARRHPRGTRGCAWPAVRRWANSSTSHRHRLGGRYPDRGRPRARLCRTTVAGPEVARGARHRRSAADPGLQRRLPRPLLPAEAGVGNVAVRHPRRRAAARPRAHHRLPW